MMERLARTRLALIADVEQDKANLLSAKRAFVLLLPNFSLPHCAQHVPPQKVYIQCRLDSFPCRLYQTSDESLFIVFVDRIFCFL